MLQTDLPLHQEDLASLHNVATNILYKKADLEVLVERPLMRIGFPKCSSQVSIRQVFLKQSHALLKQMQSLLDQNQVFLGQNKVYSVVACTGTAVWTVISCAPVMVAADPIQRDNVSETFKSCKSDGGDCFAPHLTFTKVSATSMYY